MAGTNPPLHPPYTTMEKVFFKAPSGKIASAPAFFFNPDDYQKLSYLSYINGEAKRFILYIPIMLNRHLRKIKGVNEYETEVYDEVSNKLLKCRIRPLPTKPLADKEQLLLLPFGWSDRPAVAFVHFRDSVIGEGASYLVDSPSHKFWHHAIG